MLQNTETQQPSTLSKLYSLMTILPALYSHEIAAIGFAGYFLHRDDVTEQLPKSVILSMVRSMQDAVNRFLFLAAFNGSAYLAYFENAMFQGPQDTPSWMESVTSAIQFPFSSVYSSLSSGPGLFQSVEGQQRAEQLGLNISKK